MHYLLCRFGCRIKHCGTCRLTICMASLALVWTAGWRLLKTSSLYLILHISQLQNFLASSVPLTQPKGSLKRARRKDLWPLKHPRETCSSLHWKLSRSVEVKKLICRVCHLCECLEITVYVRFSCSRCWGLAVYWWVHNLLSLCCQEDRYW